jgi:hypothetical protein
MAKIGMRIELTTLSDEAASVAPIRAIDTSFRVTVQDEIPVAVFLSGSTSHVYCFPLF